MQPHPHLYTSQVCVYSWLLILYPRAMHRCVFWLAPSFATTHPIFCQNVWRSAKGATRCRAPIRTCCLCNLRSACELCVSLRSPGLPLKQLLKELWILQEVKGHSCLRTVGRSQKWMALLLLLAPHENHQGVSVFFYRLQWHGGLQKRRLCTSWDYWTIREVVTF